MAAHGVIELTDVVVRRGQTRAVDGVTLLVEAGQWFGILGANGSGKTSLLRALAGRLPIAAGSCRLNGVDLAGDRHGRARRVGFAPPLDALPAVLSGNDLLRVVAGRTMDALAQIGAIGEALGLASILPRRIGTLSSGERQRLAIGCAFATGAELVVLDEPFNWLDPVAAVDLREALRGAVNGGLTLVTALHDLTSLARGCDEGALLAGGRVALTLGEGALADARSDLAGFEDRITAKLRG